jgi:dedicator of cytokinesis protein 1
MWFNLGQHKINFVPDMVGEFLEMTLIPETDLRKATIPIFFDMIQCEYYSSRFNAKQNRDSTMSKATFDGFQNELIIKLDFFVAEAGLGDEHFLYLFKQIMMSHCENHTSIRDSGTKYVELSAKLMELLLEYRTTNISNDSKENQMSCIVNLLDFYERIGREDLYIKYLKELTSLHEKCQNHAEAGYTILQYARLLEWTDQPLAYCWDKYRRCTTHRSLKEQLYKDIIDKFDEGKMWEKALEICKELCMQYEQETFDYTELAKLLSRMSTFYNNIMNSNEPRREPEYFRVAFVGRGFPAFLQNQTFVYRGKGCDRLDEFVARILDQFPNADTMKTMNVPTDEDKEQPVQLLQINKVDPIMDDIPMFDGKVIAPQVLKYYKLNEVSRFIYSRPFHKGMKDKENEFASLWIERTEITTREAFPGILQWFPIVEPPLVYELTPLENAIETMQKANDSLRGLLQEHTRNTNPPINPLSMKLKGIIGIDGNVNQIWRNLT